MKFCNLFSIITRAAVAGFVLVGCAATPDPDKPASLDDVLAGVPDPAMRARWTEAEAEGALPPIAAIPTPAAPVSQRQVVRVDTTPLPDVQPAISKDAVIAVQPYPSKPLQAYRGSFQVISHEAGRIRGVLVERDEPFEILYRLPNAAKAASAEARAILDLEYRDELVENSLQRRMVLADKERRSASLVSISEGARRPYKGEIAALGLSVSQADEGENPPVTFSVDGDTITLNQGETGSLHNDLTVYLLNSYAQQEQFALADPGQPYYVSFIIYQ
ncbi:MAG: hypothetical protein QNJ00_11315 [Woeseiaceae bacterium]|nr:hypothetical protein [Woeseiaceae bacterium]